jgi:hypothetical protein
MTGQQPGTRQRRPDRDRGAVTFSGRSITRRLHARAATMTWPRSVTEKAQTVTVRTASGQELAYPWATSVRVDRRGDLRVMQGLRQRAFHPCAEWASYTVKNLRCDTETPR